MTKGFKADNITKEKNNEQNEKGRNEDHLPPDIAEKDDFEQCSSPHWTRPKKGSTVMQDDCLLPQGGKKTNKHKHRELQRERESRS